jgi:uncharacterized protein (TIGR00369 family)
MKVESRQQSHTVTHLLGTIKFPCQDQATLFPREKPAMSAVSEGHASTLSTWIEEEKQMRAQLASGVGAGVASMSQMAGLSGLQMMQAMLRGKTPYPNIADTMDFVFISANEGEVIFQGTPQTKHLNPMGTVHGGWYATLLDSAVGCAVHTMMPPGRAYTTAELSVNLVRGAAPNKEPLRVIGKVIH